MRSRNCPLVLIVLLAVSCFGLGYAKAQSLSIYEIQSNTDPNGDASVYDGQIVDCNGGVCVAKFPGSRPRLILQDPAHPDGWGGIQVKDWTAGDLYDNVEIGDWVALTNMLVEEYRGTTYLQWQTEHNPGYAIASQGNPLPRPLLVSVSDIPAPLYNPDANGWFVENHDAEPYESMRLIVRNVTVTAMDLGKAVDNYDLANPAGDSCWASDYMNEDIGPWGYHPFVEVDRHFCAVAGVFEQYTKLTSGWDYYQLLTTTTADLVICGDSNGDEDVDLQDFLAFQTCFTGPGGVLDYGCEFADLDADNDVDLQDFLGFQVAYTGPS